MKEIKAYLRPSLLDPVIRGLEDAGARDITVIRVDAIAAGVNPDEHHFFQKYDAKYSAVAKVEIVCRDSNASLFAETIRKLACTGAHGDGRIFISDITAAMNIRNGSTGEEAL